MRAVLRVKWDLGLFDSGDAAMIPPDVDPLAIVEENRGLALEAAQKSIVLLKNDNATLPLRPAGQGSSGTETDSVWRVALVGPFVDVPNYGDYSGPWGQYPAGRGSTIRQGMLEHLEKLNHQPSGAAGGGGGVRAELLSAWGANSWEYKGQNVIPPYLLSPPPDSNSAESPPLRATGGGGLLATYYASTDFSDPRARRIETPALDWGIYPPAGLPSNNFSATWEGVLRSPVDVVEEGHIGVAVGPHTTARLFIDDARDSGGREQQRPQRWGKLHLLGSHGHGKHYGA